MRFLFIALLLYIGYRIIISLTSSRKTPERPTGSRETAEATHRDPVCGVYVTEEKALIGRYEGERHFFCSMDCLEKFRERLDHTDRTSPS
ncbi:MAG TPA: YHS domain-containing protein [Desulfuromonadales bacterium]|nr:YHS domain-containing protein [Desulfuromonadales bacterium]